MSFLAKPVAFVKNLHFPENKRRLLFSEGDGASGFANKYFVRATVFNYSVIKPSYRYGLSGNYYL